MESDCSVPEKLVEEVVYNRKSDPEAKVITEITWTGPLIICRTRLTVLLYHVRY